MLTVAPSPDRPCREGSAVVGLRMTAPLLMVVLVANGLLLNGVEADSCYWCGPAAEQVHRSRRPPPCRAPLDPAHVITCDPTHPYCATVATAPPFTESRICTKHSKESCYPRFCNTTATWRMTCTCRGDLCNGEHDRRVAEAFAELAGYNVTMTTAAETTPRTTTAATAVAMTTRDVHEFHNALEINTLWPLSSESETAERLPAAEALRGEAGEPRGEAGGGEDDEDSSEGSGAALRSDAPRPAGTERTTPLGAKSTTQPSPPATENGGKPTLPTILTSITAAILFFI